MNGRALSVEVCCLAAAVVISGCSSNSDSGVRSLPADEGGPGGSTCPSPVAIDGKAAERTACTFGSGAVVADTLGISDAARRKIPIQHVVVMMQENRAYDHLFGKLGDAQPDSEPIPDSFSNVDAAGNVVNPFHLTSTCVPSDPAHQWDDMHAEVDGGKMDGFVKNAAATSSPSSDGHFVMGYYEEADLPFYYFLAKTFSLADRYFPSVRSGTWANRDYLYAATSDGIKNTLQANGILSPDIPTIFSELTQASVTWNVYADNAPLSFALGWPLTHEGVRPVQDLIDGFASGNLPSVVFVDGKLNVEDDHPPADLQVGEAWAKKVYDAAVASPLWQSTVIFWTFDEAGGFADHVPPPNNDCVARPDNPNDKDFFELGVRVPLVAISPWARRHHVSHLQHEHTSITRFIELLFDLPALTARDANSDALLDLFDFDCPNTDAIPTAPEAGTGGCHPDGGS
jgi:phospholipase C